MIQIQICSKWKSEKFHYLGFHIPKNMMTNFLSVSLDNFIKHKPLISEEWILITYPSANFLETIVNRFLESSFQISSGFSWQLSNILRQASTDFFIASKNISGRNLDKAILTLGPINLSEDILQRTSADFSRTAWSCALQNKYTNVIIPPEKL